MKKTILIGAFAVLLMGCGGQQTPPETTVLDAPKDREEQATPQTSIRVMSTMGKVEAVRYADLSFETALPIKSVSVVNGQQVRKGDVLAQLELFELQNAVEQQRLAVEQANLQIEQAELMMKDVIIAHGYDPDQKSTVPQQVLHNADVKSGYAMAKSQLASAQSQLSSAQHELQCGTLTAPFDGLVANVNIKAHQLSVVGQPVCRVIASDEMRVAFRVMEADIERYQIGTKLSVVPLANPSACYQAIVSEVNPMVDEQGAVAIKARLENATKLFDGMNVEEILDK